ncbi:MAG: PAS domain S-box protein [Puia sp.]|nr:PAS domain S-box protein [Puia sp.]
MQPSAYAKQPGDKKEPADKNKTMRSPGIGREMALEAIIENFDGYVWSIDKRLRYKVLNSALRDKLKELTGSAAKPGDKMMDFMILLDPTKADVWKDIYEKGFNGVRQRLVQAYPINGQTTYFEVSVNPIRKGKEVAGLSCFARDITTEITNEQKLKSSEARFRALVEHGTDIIVVVDINGRIVYSSPYVEKHFNLSRDEQIGVNAFQYIYPGDLPLLSEKFMELLANPGKPQYVQARAHTNDGKLIRVEGTVTNLAGMEGVNGIVCNFRDVTEWLKTGELLQQKELQFRSLIENSADLIMMADREGKFIYGSPAVKKYLGYSEEDYFNKVVFTLVHPESIPLAEKLLGNLLANPGETFTIYLTLLHKDGSRVWVEGLATNLFDVPGVNALVANFRDISERRKAEILAKESTDRSRQLQHQLSEEKIRRQKEIMRAAIDAQEKERTDIGRELHDNVNQLLTTAKLYLACLSDKSQEPLIRRCSDSINTAIEEIRKLSKSLAQSFDREVGLQFSIEDLVENIKRMENNIRVSFDFSMPVEEKLDDKLKMTLFRIVQEQLNNILKHADASAIEILLRQEAADIRLVISDNGKGFDPRKKRNGIGISNIINRVDVFNGQVQIVSSPGKGCRIDISFKGVC